MSAEELGIFIDDYKNRYLINKNKIYKIYSAYNKKEDRQCRLKIIDKEVLKSENKDIINNLIDREVLMTQICNSENTIKFYKRMESSKSIILEFEMIENNLPAFLEENDKFSNNMELFKQLIKDLAKALRTIHQKRVIHRNISPSTIYINDNEEEEIRIIKLGEFGNAIYKKDNKFEQVGQLFYSAPEIIQNLQYDEKCDLWSLGVVLYELYFECSPYGVDVNKNVIMNTLYNYYNGKGFIFKKSKKASLDILFNGLLQIEPKKRFSSDDLYNLVFKEDFLGNEEKFLNKNENYRNIYNKISSDIVDEEKFKNKETKEGNNTEERKKQNFEKIVSFAMQDNLTNIMDFPEGNINEEEKINNILYYDENVKFINSIYKDADLFEQKTSGAFILCMDMISLKLLREEITDLFDKDKRIGFNLITTGSKCEETIKFINENNKSKKCIKNICIYCKDKEKWSSLKDKYGDIIKGVYNEREDIITYFIEKFSSKDIKAYPITRLITYNNYIKYYKERHIKISSYYGELNSEIYEQNISKLHSLINETHLQNQLSEGLEPNNEIEQLDDLIINKYTNETFYGDLNRMLRDSNLKKDSYEIVSYFTARLMYKLNDYAKQNDAYIKTGGKILKRGVKMFYSSLLPYIRTKQKIISLTSFASTTEEDKKAEFYAGIGQNLYKNSKKFSVIYKITNRCKEDWISNLISIPNNFDSQEENGIILLPFSFYLVKDIEIDYDKYTACIYLETIGRKEILEEKIKENKEICYNYVDNIFEVKN